jgi:3-phosphoshikimate 1-carboxyvinyltransferase
MMAQGLKACGVALEMGDSTLTIHGTGKPPKGLSANRQIETALDHRIAMSFLILGTATEQPITIDDVAPIRTSFPNFVALMNKLGANLLAA